MPSFSTKALASILALLGAANAHMIMKTPVPYGKSTLTNSPLDATGSDFPCKQRPGVYDPEGASNVMAIGEPQTLSFTGSAVHGGGSCQVSLSTDLNPTKSSKWMVIKSIEGGCPADVAGNLPDDPNGSGAATFQYTVPEGIAPGEYTIAWSWVNKIGNREFYMNCGPATITAAKKKRYAPTPKQSPNKRQASFPDMFVANVGNGCKTPDSKDITYPNPGADVQRSSDGVFDNPVGTCGGSNVAAGSPSAAASAPASPASTGGSSNSVAPVAPPAIPVASSAPAGASSAAASRPTKSVGGGSGNVSPGVFATGAASQSAAAPTATETATVSPLPANTAAASAAAPAPAASGTSSAPPSSAVGAQSGPCDQEGAWACSADGTSFQRCASGEWSTSMAMASGMTCTPGVSSNISMKVTGVGKRDLKSHLNRRRHAAHGSILS